MLSNFQKHCCSQTFRNITSVETKANEKHYQKLCSFALTSVKIVFYNFIYIYKIYFLVTCDQRGENPLSICFKKGWQEETRGEIQIGLWTRGPRLH